MGAGGGAWPIFTSHHRPIYIFEFPSRKPNPAILEHLVLTSF